MERCFESYMRAESALQQLIVCRTSVNDAERTLYVRFNWQFDVLGTFSGGPTAR